VNFDPYYRDGGLLLAGRSLHEVLLDVQLLLGDDSRWVQDMPACTEDFVQVKPVSPHARRWSLDGALARCCNEWGLIPAEVLKYLDQCVLQFCGTYGYPLNEDQYPLTYFADVMMHDIQLQFLGWVQAYSTGG